MKKKVKNKIEEIKEAVSYLRDQGSIKVDIEKLDEIENNYKKPQHLAEMCRRMAPAQGPLDGTYDTDKTICHSWVSVRGKNKYFYQLFRELEEILEKSQTHETLHHRKI